MDYRGQHCPICGKEFCDGDDIVVSAGVRNAVPQKRSV